MRTYTYPVTILERHLDTFGHVNNAIYLEIFEEARWDILVQHDFGMNRIHASGVGPTILEINIRFMKELRLRTEVVVKTQFFNSTSKVSTIKQWLEDKAGVQYCLAEFKIGLFDLKLRKLIMPTPEWLKVVS